MTPPGQPRETDTSEQQAMRLPATSAADTTQPPARLPQEPTTTTTTTAEAPAVGQPSVELAKKRNRPVSDVARAVFRHVSKTAVTRNQILNTCGSGVLQMPTPV